MLSLIGLLVAMRARLASLVASGALLAKVTGKDGVSRSDGGLRAVADALLPPLEALATAFDRNVIVCEAMAAVGATGGKGCGLCLTLLEVYEVAYFLALVDGARSKQMRDLAAQLFL